MFQSINPGWTLQQRARVTPLVIEGRATLLAGAPGAANAEVTIATYNFPQANNGYILKYGLDCLTPGFDFGGSVGFNLKLGGTSFFNYGNPVGQWTGPRGSVVNPLDVYLQFTGPQVITFTARRLVVLAAPLVFRAIAIGYVIPVKDEEGKQCQTQTRKGI